MSGPPLFDKVLAELVQTDISQLPRELFRPGCWPSQIVEVIPHLPECKPKPLVIDFGWGNLATRPEVKPMQDGPVAGPQLKVCGNPGQLAGIKPWPDPGLGSQGAADG